MTDEHKKKDDAVNETEEEKVVSEKDSFEDDNEHTDKTDEDVKEEMESGDKEADVYSEEGREKLEEDDEIEPWEEGFAKGAEPDKHGQ